MMTFFALMASLLVSVSAKESILETAFSSLGGLNGNDIDIGASDLTQNPVIAVVSKAADQNEDGKLTLMEFEKMSEEILDAFFQTKDVDGDGSVTEEEMLSGGFTLNGFLDFINIAFKLADINRDGFISSGDFMAIKEGPIDSRQLSLTTFLDSNEDGRISLEEYQEFGDGKLPKLPLPVVKLIKLTDRDLDGQVSREDIDNFVKAGWSIADKDKSGHITKKEQISMLKEHGLSEEMAEDFKKRFMEWQNTRITVFREIINEIDEDVDGQVGRDEFIAVLNKPFPDQEMLAKLVERPKTYKTGVEKNMVKLHFMNVINSILDDPKFSEFKSSSSKFSGEFFLILITAFVAFMF